MTVRILIHSGRVISFLSITFCVRVVEYVVFAAWRDVSGGFLSELSGHHL